MKYVLALLIMWPIALISGGLKGLDEVEEGDPQANPEENKQKEAA